MNERQAKLAKAAQAFVDAHNATAKARHQLVTVMADLNLDDLVAGGFLLTRVGMGSIDVRRIVNIPDEALS